MFDVEFKINPYPTYNRLHSQGPIHWVESFGGAWLLPRYVDVTNALSDSRLSAQRSHILLNRLPSEAQEEFAEFKHLVSRWMMFLDPPVHTDLRKLMDSGFTPTLLQNLRPRIQDIANSLLLKVKEAKQMEFMADFAYPLPTFVIAEMLGIHTSDHNDFIAWSNDIATFIGPTPSLDTARRAQKSLIAMTEYFKTLLPERRKNIGNDLISLLIQIEEQEEILTSEQLVAQCVMLLIAGHESTRNFLGNGLLTLLQHPEQLEMLKNDRSLMPKALRELLRYEGPIQFIARMATEDFILHNQQIKKDQFVISLIGAANRDPDKFTNPARLDITREKGSHLA